MAFCFYFSTEIPFLFIQCKHIFLYFIQELYIILDSLWTLLYSSGEHWCLFWYAVKLGGTQTANSCLLGNTSNRNIQFLSVAELLSSSMHMCGSGIKQWLMQSLYTKFGALILWVSPFQDSFSPHFLVVEWLWLTRIVSSGKFSMRVLANLPRINFSLSSG